MKRHGLAVSVGMGALGVAALVHAETSAWTRKSDPDAATPKAISRPVVPAAPQEQPSLFKPGANTSTHAKSVMIEGDDAAYMAFDQGQYLTALKLAEAGAKAGDATSHTLIGRLYAEGLGVSLDPAKAAGWYKRGSELGDANATFALGLLYAEGRGVKKDRAVAADLFEKAAMTGHPEANYNLGLLFLKGEGKPENPYRAAQHIRYAAEKGIAQAQYDYGTLFQLGAGVPFDALEASRWIGRAAEQGLPAAQYDYAVMLLKGMGLKRDEGKAMALLKAAADRDIPGAQNRLAHIYLEGAGLDKIVIGKNLPEAFKWRLVAKAGGIKDDEFDAVIAKLSAKERAPAEAAAAEWRERSLMTAGQ